MWFIIRVKVYEAIRYLTSSSLILDITNYNSLILRYGFFATYEDVKTKVDM